MAATPSPPSRTRRSPLRSIRGAPPPVAAAAAARRADPGAARPLLTWPFDLTVYAGLLLPGFAYAALARGRADVSRRRFLYFTLGLLTIWLALEQPIYSNSDQYLQSGHMLQHVLDRTW